MELNWQIESHPNSLKRTAALTEWLNRIVCTIDTTLEIPINENIFYPVSIPVDPQLKGVSNLMLVKAAFQFYFETAVNTTFLKCAKLAVKRGAKTWYEYIELPLLRQLQPSGEVAVPLPAWPPNNHCPFESRFTEKR
jgi:hypothetical protein